MTTRILIAGGYGFVGSAIARLIRASSKDAEFILAGRNPENGTALARELGRAGTAYLDVADPNSLSDLGPIDLTITALDDPGNALLHAALTRGIAHIGITTKAEDVAPIAFAALQSPPKRPIVLLGSCAAGVATIVAQRAARDFSRVDSIEIAALFDMRDPVGPMTADDAESLVSRALVREGGTWTWVEGPQRMRPIRLSDDHVLDGLPTSLLDVPSLAALTGAANVRLDIVQGDSLGTRAGGAASSDVYIYIDGMLKSGGPGKQRIVISDPNGVTHLTALGVLFAAERVLGLDGRAPAAGGLYLPETLLSPEAAIGRYQQSGVQIRSEQGQASSAMVCFA